MCAFHHHHPSSSSAMHRNVHNKRRRTEPPTTVVIQDGEQKLASAAAAGGAAGGGGEGAREQDVAYFGSYGDVMIHGDMLRDRSRSEWYRDVIYNNRETLFKGKTVLDIGCGTGILSLFAADAGATKIYAIECSDMARYAKDIITANGHQSVIEVIHSKVEDIPDGVIPPHSVDVIVSEWMGYFMVYEGMLQSVIFARDKWLKKEGDIIPSHAKLYIAPFTWDEYYDDNINFWKDVYGKDMSCMIPMAMKKYLGEPVIDSLCGENIISEKPCTILDLDCRTATTQQLAAWQATFSFKSIVAANFAGLASWFDVSFSKHHHHQQQSQQQSQQQHLQQHLSPSRKNQIMKEAKSTETRNKPFTLSTSPFSPETHWAQTMFFLDQPTSVQQDDILEGSIRVKTNARHPRSLDITITIGDQSKDFALT